MSSCARSVLSGSAAGRADSCTKSAGCAGNGREAHGRAVRCASGRAQDSALWVRPLGTASLDVAVRDRQDATVPQPERVAIRPYCDDDRPTIEALFDQFQDDLVELDPLQRLRRQAGYGAEQTARTLRAVADRGKFLVAERGIELAGFVVAIVRETTSDDELEVVPTRRGRIEELYVHSDHRGTGIGRALMAEVEAWLRSEACDVLSVEVFAPNERARRFYEHLGYVPRDIDHIKVL
jgi:GNAT superfamily N-acetyltransferase